MSSSSEIANPERGWYDDYYSFTGGSNLSGDYIPLAVDELTRNRVEDNITLILRLFYLHQFLDESEVGAVYLEKMQDDFDAIRSAGVKCVIRFAYSASQDAEIWDATPEIVLAHIASLKPVLTENSDVIAGIQAGFIGAWGEWYYTENFAGANFIAFEEDQQNRRMVIEALLDAVPENIAVQGRTPAIIQNATQSDQPISDDEAYDGTNKSRIGHHNDCFLANASDYGTYTNLDEDISYLSQSTKYTISGGETCDASNEYSDCELSVPRMKELHWTYLNRDYNRQVYTKWREQECHDEINLALGYRLSLKQAEISETIDVGGTLNFEFVFVNEGYAAPTQNKDIQLVLTSLSSGTRTAVDYGGSNTDIRHWQPGETSLSGSVVVPAFLDNGNYMVGIRFKDQTMSLADDPAYSIQLAHFGEYDTESGVNELNLIVSIGNGGSETLPITPGNLIAESGDSGEISLTWNDLSDDENSFQLIRSHGDTEEWFEVAVIDADLTTWNDTNLTTGTTFHYRIRSVNEYGYSPWSDLASATTSATITSISQNDLDTLLLYPNPSDDEDVYIHFKDHAVRQVTIHDMNGVKVLETKTNKKKLKIDQEGMRVGTYIISVLDSNGRTRITKLILTE